MVYYYFPYSWVGGLILYIKRPQPENRRFVPMGFFFPICSQTRWGVLHVPSSQPRHRDLMLWPIAHVPWQTVRTSAEICWVDGSENPKATWDGAKILFKNTTSTGELIPDFWLPSTISGPWLWNVLQYLKILWGLPVSVEVCQATSHPTTTTQRERLHRELHAPLVTTQITCKTWAVMKAVESFGWLLVKLQIFLEFSPWVFAEDEAILTHNFSKGLVQPPTSSLPEKLSWHLLSCPT